MNTYSLWTLTCVIMEFLMRMLLMFNTINMFKNSVANIKVSFAYNEDHNNHCGSRISRFYASRNTPFNTCLIQCGVRPSCKAVNFRRLMDNLCELQLNDDTTEGESGCLFIPRENINFTGKLDNSCGCEEGHTCDIRTKTCTKRECSPFPTVQYGKVLGNQYTIGSRLSLHCNYGYKPQDDTVIECLSTGEWNSSFTCIPRWACPTNWHKFGTSCFHVATNAEVKMEKLTAEVFCVSLGGHLVQIDTEEESNFIYNLIKDTPDDLGFWIGLVFNISSNQWYWLNSRASPSYTHWGRTQPGNIDGEYCTILFKRDNFMWHDVPCSRRARPICKRNANEL